MIKHLFTIEWTLALSTMIIVAILYLAGKEKER